MYTKFESENHNRGVYLEDLCVDGWVVLKRTLRKSDCTHVYSQLF